MAGSRIVGITVEIGGDTTGLNKALSGVNKEINDTQKQLKDVEKLLKLDPTNTQLLEQKQRLLGDAVGATKTKLETLKSAAKQANEQLQKGEITQKQYDALQREIIEVENELGNLEKAAQKSNATLNKIGGVADKVANGAGNLAQKTKGMSMAAGGAITGLIGMAYNAGLAADDLNTLSKQSGFSTQELQKWKYASDLVDVSVDDMVGAAAKLKKNMSSSSKTVTEAFNKLGISAKNSDGTMRSSTDVFYEVVAALSTVGNETERDQLAMDLFGKSADSLAGIIDDGGVALQELGAQAEAAGLILSQDALDSANQFNDAVDTLKATAGGAFAAIGTEIIEMLLPHIDGIVEAIKGVLEWIANLDSSQIAMIGTILAVVAGLSPLMSVISAVASAISFITGTVIPALSAAISFLMANPIVLLVAAIAGVAVAVATKGDEIQAALAKVDTWLQGVFVKDWTQVFGPVIGNLMNAFFKNLSNIWDSVKQMLNGIIDFVRGVFTGDWKRAWGGVKDVFGGIFKGLIAVAKAPINTIIGMINAMIGGLNAMTGGLANLKISIPDWVPGIGGKSFGGINVPKIPTLPLLAKGGVLSYGSAIVGEAGPELLTNAGGRSIVQPLTNNNTANYAGTTINVYAQPGQDVRELAALISEELANDYEGKRAVFA